MLSSGSIRIRRENSNVYNHTQHRFTIPAGSLESLCLQGRAKNDRPIASSRGSMLVCFFLAEGGACRGQVKHVPYLKNTFKQIENISKETRVWSQSIVCGSLAPMCEVNNISGITDNRRGAHHTPNGPTSTVSLRSKQMVVNFGIRFVVILCFG